jgi:uncharacterized membrane protein YdbT with pleckstrin-like domain
LEKKIDMELTRKDDKEALIIDEIQVLLKEKRTSLAVMRTGITILIVQIMVSGFLIATSKSHQFLELLHVAIPFYAINAFLLLLGLYLIISSLVHIRHYDRTILSLKKKHRRISDLMDFLFFG